MKYEIKFKSMFSDFIVSADTDKNTVKIERLENLGEVRLPGEKDITSICRALDLIMYNRKTIFTLSREEFNEFQKIKEELATCILKENE